MGMAQILVSEKELRKFRLRQTGTQEQEWMSGVFLDWTFRLTSLRARA